MCNAIQKKLPKNSTEMTYGISVCHSVPIFLTFLSCSTKFPQDLVSGFCVKKIKILTNQPNFTVCECNSV